MLLENIETGHLFWVWSLNDEDQNYPEGFMSTTLYDFKKQDYFNIFRDDYEEWGGPFRILK